MWGGNKHGQLGIDTKPAAEVREPTPLVDAGEFVQLACSHFHSLGLRADGAAYSWGRGTLGLLGHGDEADAPVPRRIAGLPLRAVACGAYHTVGVSTDGQLFSWGWALEGGLVPTETFFVSPRRLPGVDESLRFSGVAWSLRMAAVSASKSTARL